MLLTLILAQALTLRNGDMEAGSTVPQQWENKWVGKGTLTPIRDTKEKHGGVASLQVLAGPGSQGQVSQVIEAPGGKTVTVSGWIKTAGNIKAVFAVQPFAGDWSKNEFKQVGFAQNESDWQKFSQTITLPTWAARFGICLFVDGEGKAWLDDVELSGYGVQKEDKTIPPDAQEPTTPYRGYWPQYPDAWNQTFAGLKGEASKGGKDVVFLGDSITQGWKEDGDKGKAVFERVFAPLKSINLGIGGDKTCQLLYRIDNGQLDGLDPKVVVLNIGVNNMWAGDYSAEKIASGVFTVIERIQKKLPKAKILNIGILPTQEFFDNPLRLRVNAVNALLEKHADGKRVIYADLSKDFLDSNGHLSRDVMPDLLHPNAKGYEIYAAALAPKVKALLK